MTTINAQINPSTKIVAKSVTLHDVSAESVGLGNVDNTSDINKPISTAAQAALDLKANQSTTYTKAEVDNNIANLVDTAPATLDTLNELAAALGDDANFATSVTDSIATKASQTDLDTHTDDTTNPHNVTATQVGLGNVTNESKATMFTDPSFTGDLTNFSGETRFNKIVRIKPEKGLGLQLFSSGSNNSAVSLQVQGPTTVGHDLFQRSGFTNGFGDGSNHFHSLIDINRIEQEPSGDVHNTKRVQERYYAIPTNNLPNNKAVFWAQHRVARPISAAVVDTSAATLDVSLLQDSTNRSSSNQVFFVSNSTPLNKSEELTITLNSHSLSTGNSVRMTFGQAFQGPIVAAALFGKVTSTTTNTFNVELYGGNYKTTSEVPDGNSQTALTFDEVVLETIGTNTIVQSGNETNLQLYSKTNFTPNRLKDETLKATWSVAHGLVKNEHCTLITDGRGDLVISQSAYVLDPDPDGDGLSVILVYGRRIKQFDLSSFTAFGSTNWTLHKGSIDGIHDDTLGDNLFNFNANNKGEYTAYQIGPGSQTDADCIAIGKNVYNKDASTIKIGYDNAMLDVRSDGIVVDGNISASGTLQASNITPNGDSDLLIKTNDDTGNAITIQTGRHSTSSAGNINIKAGSGLGGGNIDFFSDAFHAVRIDPAGGFFAGGAGTPTLYVTKSTGSSTSKNRVSIGTGSSPQATLDVGGNVLISESLKIDGVDVLTTTTGYTQAAANAAFATAAQGALADTATQPSDLGNLATVSSGAINFPLIPSLNVAYSLGSPSKIWGLSYFGTAHASRIELNGGTAGTTDTTLTRSAAGVLAVEGVDVLTTTTGYTQAAANAAFATAAQGALADTAAQMDYQYGSFTPKLALNGSLEQSAYAKQEGYYVKIGRLVTVNIIIKVTHFDSAFKTAAANSEIGITGLPHSAKIEGSDGPDTMIVQVHPRKGWQNLGDNSYSGSVGQAASGVIFFEKTVGQGEFGPAPGAGVGWNYERIQINDFHFHPFNFTADGEKAFTFQISGTYITDDDI